MLLVLQLRRLQKYRQGRRSCDITAKLLIHQSQAGCVIGKAGAQLKECRANFGVDIKVYPQCCPLSTQRIVQMIGGVSGVTRCIISICKLLNDVCIFLGGFFICSGLQVESFHSG